MRREDCVDLLSRIPLVDHPQINFVLQNRMVVTVDVIIRTEPSFLVIRGREGGSTDEGRGFFLCYDEISYIRLEKVVKVGEMKRMFGDHSASNESVLDAAAEARAAADAQASAGVDTQTPPPTASPMSSQDPASIAKQNLLDRIRAARANVAGTTGRLSSKS